MLEEGSATDHMPVFVAGGRRRHNAVRLAGTTLGLLLAGWLAALAAGVIGFGPLPGLSLPGADHANPAPAGDAGSTAGDEAVAGTVRLGPSSTFERTQRTQGSHPTSRVTGDATSQSAAGSARSGTSAGASDPSSGAVTTPAPAGTGGGSTTPPADTGNTTPPGGTGGTPQGGNEPSWTPPASGTKSATPPRGNSSSAPGMSVSASAVGTDRQTSG
jgi:hypothetical protein